MEFNEWLVNNYGHDNSVQEFGRSDLMSAFNAGRNPIPLETVVGEKITEANENALFIKKGNTIVNIKDLPIEEYEQLLEVLRQVQAFYTVMKSKGNFTA